MIKEFAPAKVNLFLHVTGKRADGYRTLDSAVAFADIGDAITLEPAADFSFAMNGPFAKNLSEQNNLIVKAARMMAEKYGRDLNCKITLTKNLPVASGIGGGSADAAATLRALLRHWDTPSPNPSPGGGRAKGRGADEIYDIALTLGADVPVCLTNKPQSVRGIGEKLQEIHCASMALVLVNPGQPCPTAEVFSKFSGSFKTEITLPEKIDIPFLQQQTNGLTDAACAIVPDIENILKTLNEYTPLARLSGSGATCFGLFKKFEGAQNAAEKIQKQNPHWWIKAAMTF